MKEEYNNTMVYDFLIEECKQRPDLWEKFKTGLLSHSLDSDFWDELREELDCFRVCDECGKPMIVGYVVDECTTYCSDECLHKHLTDEDFKALYDDGNGNSYWTTWYEDSFTYENKRML